jgi:kynurenine formamidase
MWTRQYVLTAALAVTAYGCTSPAPAPPAPPFPQGEIVDLSHVYDASTVFWPTADKFRLDSVANGVTPGGYFYAANNFFMAEHGGTHIDAPVHFAAGGASVDQVPLQRLIGSVVVIDVSDRAASDRDYQVTAEDIQRIEQRDGQIPPDSILVIYTGLARRWPDAEQYLGTAERGEAAVAKLHFPGLLPDAASWLVANRRIKAIGIDTASIDFGQSTAFMSHRVLFAASIPAFENLTQLDRLPARGATLIALPMKIGGGSGGPLRAIAILPSPAAQ